MKLIAQRNFWYKDTLRGKMVSVKKGEEFSLPNVREDAEQIFSIISSLSAYPTDPEFVPESEKYLCLHPFSYQKNGEEEQVIPQEIVILNRENAVKYMTSGHCRPVDLNAWTPRKLLDEEIKSRKEINRMYDSEPESRENWMKHRIKGGAE